MYEGEQVMIHALAVLITTASIAGLGIIIEGATHVTRKMRAILSPPFDRREKGGREDEPTDEEE